MTVEIYVATHKDYEFPKANCYYPIHVGKEKAKVDLGIIGDNTGDNISELNSTFCELTALYWMWKNSFADILGLVHYRRYFIGKDGQILTEKDINTLGLDEIIVATKKSFYKVKKIFGLRISKNQISVREHYAKDHYERDFNKLRDIVASKSPDYLEAFDSLCDVKDGISLFNMFIMHRELVDEYCKWMFPILFELEQTLDITSYDTYQRRIYGFLSERMFNVFLIKNKERLNLRYADVVMK
ncbi:DUF4422 domain-containing protein [Acinetobacter piscicola]|uniref:DUF4422 domain-containing protein n=1 Tax=Acinetobacter piscicola TaxID=2006115 RepID=UPI003555DCBB